MTRRLIIIAAALNLLGIVCFSLATTAHDPLEPRNFDYVNDPSSVLNSFGFVLMMPGIFFATVAFICARFFAWSEQGALAVWYAAGFAINIIIAWKLGEALSPHPTPHNRSISEELL